MYNSKHAIYSPGVRLCPVLCVVCHGGVEQPDDHGRVGQNEVEVAEFQITGAAVVVKRSCKIVRVSRRQLDGIILFSQVLSVIQNTKNTFFYVCRFHLHKFSTCHIWDTF
jgi:hypothetical protein